MCTYILAFGVMRISRMRIYWEDVALEVTVSSVECTDVTCATHSG